MTESRTCSRCGADLPRDAPGGHCLPCLLQLGLQSDETAGEDVAAGVPPASEGGILPPGPSLAEKPGDRIGHYKLLQQIGEGGCGVVYMAEQEEPVRRRVALKIIKLGMDTRNVIARFEAERQALAMMDHPNIAKVFDAGVTEAPLPTSGHPLPSSDEGRGQGEGSPPANRHPSLATHYGRPYFVMELVRGVKITSYCDQQKLSTRQRLDLFIQVCQAVQHAHQKGIIHRDIKPSNILVTEQDGTPVPKIIDFGIAKATGEQRLTDKTLFTAFEQFIGTPAYMSPEQAGLGGLDIDTRTDIYSLGVLLYELLAGQPPFDPEELRRSALDEILRVIREQEPPRPSTCLTKLTKQELTTVAERRQIEATKLPHLLRGDLDWIVMKALEKDRRRRYETANGLARDLERFVNNEPVTARPPSNLYRFQKLVRRNKLAFVAVGAVSLALLLGFGVSTCEFLKERQARHRATTEAAKSQQVAQFLADMLKGVGPSVALGRDTTMLREILDKTAERVGKDLTNQPEVQIELRTRLAGVYHDLALYQQVEAMARENLEVARSFHSAENQSMTKVLVQLGDAHRHLGQLDQAETYIREALAMQRRSLGNEHRDVANSLHNLAMVLHDQGKLAEAEALNREVLTMRKKLFGNEDPRVADSLGSLAIMLLHQGKLAEAEVVGREAMAIYKKRDGNENPDLAGSTITITLGNVLDAQGKLAEAEALHREVLTMRKKLLGNEDPLVADLLRNLALVLAKQGKLDEAESLHREELVIREKKRPDDWQTFDTRIILGNSLLGQKKYTEAEPLLLSGYEGMKQRKDKIPAAARQHPRDALNLLVKLYEETGRSDQAEVLLRRALDLAPDDADALDGLGRVFGGRRQFAEAEKWFRKALEKAPNDAFYCNDLGVTCYELGRIDEAEALHRRALELGHDDPRGYTGMGRVCEAREQFAESEKWYRKAVEKASYESIHLYGSSSYFHNLALLYEKQGKLDQAEEARRRFLQRNTNDPEALNGLAWHLAERGIKLDEALALAARAVEVDSKDAAILDTLGWVHYQRGELDEAEKVLQKATDLAGQTPVAAEIREHLKKVQEKKGKPAP